MSTFKTGDVLRYVPRRYHCKEGTAFVTERGTPLDTYWGPGGNGEYGHLRPEELATAEVVFNVNDYDALDIYANQSRATWLTYHPDDRGRITSQHGLQEALFVRKGATPDLATQIQNARDRVDEAESRVQLAEHILESRRRELAELGVQS